jgi:hypothetical protein
MKGKKMLNGMVHGKGRGSFASGGAVARKDGGSCAGKVDDKDRDEKACGGAVSEKRLDKKPMRSAGGRFARATGGKVELESDANGCNKVGAHVKSPLSGA